MDDTTEILNRIAHDMNVGQTAGAIDKLRDVLTMDPDSALGHALLASCLIEQRRIHAARHEADLAIQLRPELDYPHRIRGFIAMSENDLDRMRDAMNEAVSLDPEDPANLIGLARYHQARGDAQTARQLAQKALEMTPDDVDAAIFTGELALADGDLGYAHQAAQGVLSQNPESVDGLVLLGNAVLRKGDIPAARDLALWALQLDAADHGALSLLAAVKMRENKVLGLFWKFQTWLGRLGAERAMLVLIFAFVLYSFGRVALVDLGYQQYGNILQMVWLGLCLYTWVGAGIQNRMVQKELQRVRLRPEF